MSLINGYIFPHPPIILPEIGRGEEANAQKTIDGVNFLAQEITREKPSTIIVITPHGPMFEDAVCISIESRLKGDMGRFGKPEVKFEFENNTKLTKLITQNAVAEGISVGEVNENMARHYRFSTDIDHGTLVPLYFVNKNYTDYKLVHISIGLLPYEDLYKFGMCITKAIETVGENTVVIASGDLSHRLTKDAPAGFSERGAEFDTALISSLKNYDIENIFSFESSLVECAGECGLRPIVMLLGALDKAEVMPHVISYEGPFGVGYSTVKFEITGEKKESYYNKLIDNRSDRILKIRNNEDEYVSLARKSLEEYVRTGRTLLVPEATSEELLQNAAGVFVSIKKHGQLRGCIGTISPTRSNIAEETIYNAISAGTKDPRFYSVEQNELEELVYSVDVLKSSEPIESKEQLDVERYGVIVRKGNRSGLLLPNLEGVDTIDEQIAIALSKAGIKENENYTMERFEVIRHGSK